MGLPSIWSSQGLAEEYYCGLSSYDRKFTCGYDGLDLDKSIFVCGRQVMWRSVFGDLYSLLLRLVFCYVVSSLARRCGVDEERLLSVPRDTLGAAGRAKC